MSDAFARLQESVNRADSFGLSLIGRRILVSDARAIIAAYDAAVTEREEARREVAQVVARVERRERMSTTYWMRAAKEALAGDMRALRNRVDMHDAPPVAVVLSDGSNLEAGAHKGD